MRGGKGHAHEDPPRHQCVENRLRESAIAATVNGDEIGGRGEGAEPVFFGDLGDPAARLGDLSLNLFQVALILHRRQSPRLRRAV